MFGVTMPAKRFKQDMGPTWLTPDVAMDGCSELLVEIRQARRGGVMPALYRTDPNSQIIVRITPRPPAQPAT